MPILDLRFTNIGPFDDIAFEFDEHVNVFVGPNNSGKSTALMVLGELVVFPFPLPTKLLRKARAEFTIHVILNGSKKKELKGSLPIKLESKEELERWEGIQKGIVYTSFIPALRQSTDFRSKGPIIQKKQEHTLPPPPGAAVEDIRRWSLAQLKLEEFGR